MANHYEIKQILLKALQNTLPGKTSHLNMIPESRLKSVYNYEMKRIKQSAVLLVLFPENNTFKLLFIKRVKDGSNHSGQTAFPGGKFEESDKDLVYTALRETEEEIGINSNEIKILKMLTPLYIPVSNFMVTPFVGMLEKKPEIDINTKEVYEVYELDFKKILTVERTDKIVTVRNQSLTAPFYVFDNFEVWGASAMILSEFSDLLKTEFNNNLKL